MQRIFDSILIKNIKNLEQPPQLDDKPLHGSQVEEHRDEEVEEVDDGQHLTIRIRTFFNKIHF